MKHFSETSKRRELISLRGEKSEYKEVELLTLQADEILIFNYYCCVGRLNERKIQHESDIKYTCKKCPTKLLQANLEMLRLAKAIEDQIMDPEDLYRAARKLHSIFSTILSLEGAAVALLVCAWIEKVLLKNDEM